MNNNNKDNNNKEKAGVKRYLLEVGFITENVFMKLFFCALFLRIFFSSASPNGSSRGRRMRTIIKVVTMVTILGGLGFIFGVVWQCIPIQAVWRRVVDDGGRRMEGTRCLNQKMFFYSFGVFDVLMDLIVSWILITIPSPPSPLPIPDDWYFISCCELTIDRYFRSMSFRSLFSTLSPSPTPTDSA